MIQELFEEVGGKFILSFDQIIEKNNQIKAYLLDWDGVFNNGQKYGKDGSLFNEADSMGLNLLRFSYWMKHGTLPIVGILSGERNETAITWTNRESIQSCYFKCGNKTIALNHFLETHLLQPNEIAYIFDDVLDLKVAEIVGLRFFLPRTNNPLFNQFVIKNSLADYCTSTEGGNFAIREIAELMIAANGNFDEVIENRLNYSSIYYEYIQIRNSIKVEYFTLINNQIINSL